MIRNLMPVALVLALGGCASSTHTPAAVASSPSPSPSPSPTVSVEQLKSWVEATVLTADVVGAPKPVDDQPSPPNTVDVCGKQLPSDSHVAWAHYWRWAGGKQIDYVEHTVAAYQGVTGADVLNEMKTTEEACAPYEQSDPYGSAQMTPQGAYTFSTPTGVDSGYGYCVRSDTLAPAKDKGQKAYLCTGTLVRGDIVDSVRVFGTVATLSSAQHNLNAAIAAAGAALTRAVPADYH